MAKKTYKPKGKSALLLKQAKRLGVKVIDLPVKKPLTLKDLTGVARVKRRRLPPDPEGMNGMRAMWADFSIATFMRATRCDKEDALGDLLCNLGHWCDRNGYDFEKALESARCHYEEETNGKGKQL